MVKLRMLCQGFALAVGMAGDRGISGITVRCGDGGQVRELLEWAEVQAGPSTSPPRLTYEFCEAVESSVRVQT